MAAFSNEAFDADDAFSDEAFDFDSEGGGGGTGIYRMLLRVGCFVLLALGLGATWLS